MFQQLILDIKYQTVDLHISGGRCWDVLGRAGRMLRDDDPHHSHLGIAWLTGPVVRTLCNIITC